MSSRVGLAARLLRDEGLRSILERALDRRADERRAAAFDRSAPSAARAPGDAAPRELRILPFPMVRRYGGTAIQLLVELERRAAEEPIALLHGAPGALRAELWGKGLARPLFRELGGSGLDAEAVASAARWAGASSLHFESLAGVSPALPLTLAERGFEVAISIHDFALYCRRPHLLEEPAGKFCGFSTDRARCAACLARDWALPELAAEDHREEAARLLSIARAIVFPSEYLRREHARLFPALPLDRTLVRPPRPLDGGNVSPRSVERAPRRIAFAGSLQRHKGARVLVDVIERVRAAGRSSVEWHVFGASGGGDKEAFEALRRLGGVRLHGYYRAGTLPRRLVQAKVDLVLLPSIWPEAHCLVLDECAAAGVPVLAFDLGAPGERIAALRLGETVPAEAGATAMAAAILARG
jgi:hypothetical protein